MHQRWLELIVCSEGGYTTDPKDRGNWTTGVCGKGECKGTKYGISAMSYPTLDICNLSRDEAVALYKKDYWDKVQGDTLPEKLAYVVTDTAVNMGVTKAIKLMQEMCGIKQDGIFGAITTTRIKEYLDTHGEPQAIKVYLDCRIKAYKKLSNFPRYGKGWLARVDRIKKQVGVS